MISSEIYVAHKVPLLVVCMVLKDPAHQALGDDVSIVSTCELIQLYLLNPAFSCRNVNITFVSFIFPGYLSRSCKLHAIS